MKDIDNEPKSESKTNDKKTVGVDKKAPRRGVWKRIKVRPGDGLEASETQNVGKQLTNSVPESGKITNVKTTTVKPEEETTQYATTEKSVESTKGMFDEARKALTALFSSEDESEDNVNVEETDEKLEEELQESSTTVQTPTTTEEPITTTTTTEEVTTQKPQKKSVSVSSSKKVQTSSSQKVTGEICYRGRCIKTDEK
jgi:hypothetical protein